MLFDFNKSLEILERTPVVLETLLRDLPPEWTHSNEGKDSFSPFDVVGHLIHGEKTDWMSRINIIMSDRPDKTFTPYDRFAQRSRNRDRSMNELLTEFKSLRLNNLEKLRAMNLTEGDLLRTGIHPKLGTVTLQQLLSTWTVHDLSHIAQITRVMCKQYKDEVGPWIEYLGILTRY